MLYFDILYLCVALLPKNCDDRGTSRCGVDNQDNIGVSMCSLWKGVEMRLRRERRAWRGMRLQTGFCVFVACGLALGTTSCDDWYWDSSIYDGLMQNFDIETNRETGKSTVAQQARISYDGSCSLPESLAENWLRCTPIENNGQLETCEPASLRDLIVLRFNDYSYIRDKKAEDGNASNDDADRTGTQAPMAQPQNEKQGFIVETYCALWSGVEGLPPVCEKMETIKLAQALPPEEKERRRDCCARRSGTESSSMECEQIVQMQKTRQPRHCVVCTKMNPTRRLSTHLITELARKTTIIERRMSSPRHKRIRMPPAIGMSAYKHRAMANWSICSSITPIVAFAVIHVEVKRFAKMEYVQSAREEWRNVLAFV